MDEAVAIEQLPVPPWLRLHPGHQLFHSHCQALHCSPKASNSHDVSNEGAVYRSSVSPVSSNARHQNFTSATPSTLQLTSQGRDATQGPSYPDLPSSSANLPQFGSRPQCLKRGRVLFQTMHSPLTHHVTSNQSSRLRHQRLRAGPTAFAQHHNALDTITLKAMDTLLLQVLDL
ncbi:hypothetical protein MHU86_20698 [Fragilaria crotonensis]|nr:hypothetical protein MHU86_20698 [Fragilaria crotonensis]